MGFELSWYWDVAYPYYGKPIDRDFDKPFSPHEETGRYFLVEMEKKLANYEYERYMRLLMKEWAGEPIKNFEKYNVFYFMQWLTYKPELCFEKIIEVIG